MHEITEAVGIPQEENNFQNFFFFFMKILSSFIPTADVLKAAGAQGCKMLSSP